MSDTPKLVVAVQKDGLAQRLATIANVIRVTRPAGLRPGFIWPIADGVPPVEALFDPQFIADHLIVDFDPAEFAALPPGPLRGRKIDAVAAEPAFRGISTVRWEEPIELTRGNLVKIKQTRRSIFEALPFVPTVRAVMDRLAQSVTGEMVVLELWRAGSSADFLPSTILQHRLRALKEEGRTVVLVGDDEATMAEFSETYDVPIAAHLGGAVDAAGVTMANLTAMMRAGEVVGSKSAMARAAAAISRTTVTAAVDGIDPDELVALLRAATFSNVSDQRALALTHYALARALPEDGDDRLAALEAAHAADPDDILLARALVRPFIKRQRFEDAEAMIRETAERAFNSSNKAATGMCALYGDAATMEEALDLANACEVHPGPYLHAQLSAVLHELQSYEKSYAAAHRAFALDPLSALLSLRLGEQAFRARHHEIARKAFAQAVEDAPDSAIARIGLADAQIALGNNNTARDQMAEAVRLAPDNALFVARLAYMEELRGNSEEANTLIMRATALAPGDADVLGIVSRIYESRKEFGQAIRTLESVDGDVKAMPGMRHRERTLRKAIREGEKRSSQGSKAPKLPHELDLSKPKRETLISAMQDALSKWWHSGKKSAG